MGLVLPYLFITKYGSETNGLLSSVLQLYTCLDLLEAGVGVTTIQALYGPIAHDDKEGINRILSATNVFYLRTGIIYSVLIAIVTLLYPMVVDSQLPDSTIRLVVILQGVGHVINYFFQAKYKHLLSSEGKIYILNTAQTIESLIRNFGKVVVIYLGFGVVLVQCVQLIAGLVYCILVILYVKTRYKWIDFKQIPNFQALNQKNAVVVQAVSWTIFNQTDILLLTVATHDLVLVSIYSVYLLIYTCIQNFLEAIINSFKYEIGLAAQKSKLQLNLYYSKYRIFNLALAIAAYLIVYVFIVPFLELYTAEISGANYIMPGLPILFFALKVLYALRTLNKSLIEATGHFRGTQHIPVVETIVNVVVSVALVIRYNIYGVLVGTVAALAISEILYMIYNTKNILEVSIRLFLKDYIMFVPAILLVVYIRSCLDLSADTYIELVIIAIPVSIALVTLFAILCFIRIKIDELYFKRIWGAKGSMS